ncbi:CRISPR-associated endonuclease Cas2 [Limnohabitans sp. DM1]|uniref:CRISPR-associated endonuclease Cas2 n=1 Tax=Limnohabitans sp. DM1 TaxID=1597955 RepID=UPI000A6379EE|nr:CRISPR-associated endonuclease Cas2 [Limnohabitans sp. DM1]
MATKTHRMQSIPHSHAQRWLLAHDIRDKKRLQRVWRFLRQEGVRLQYSVYLLAGTRQQVENIIDRLRELIDEAADDVRIYPLTENTRIWGLGTQFNDDGNTLSDAFMDKLRALEQDTEPSNAEDVKRLNLS